jgi:hypothetical protein
VQGRAWHEEIPQASFVPFTFHLSPSCEAVLREGLSRHMSEGQEARNTPEVTEFAIGSEAAESTGATPTAINEKELLLSQLRNAQEIDWSSLRARKGERAAMASGRLWEAGASFVCAL